MSLFRRTLVFRLVSFLCVFLMAFTASAQGLMAAYGSAASLLASVNRPRPPKFSVTPQVRQVPPGARRDAQRGAWWTPDARADLQTMRIRVQSANPANQVASTQPMFMAASLLLGSWGTAASAGSPIPGEGSFSVLSSGASSPNGSSGTLNTATGNLLTALPLFSFGIRGDQSVGVTLFHNSDSLHVGDLGGKWSHSYDSFISLEDKHAILQMPDGLLVPYYMGNGTFERPAGWFANLEQDGTSLKVTFKNQDVWTYALASNGVYYLVQQRDRHSNIINIARNSASQVTTVTPPCGRVVTFAYNTGGKLQSVTGPMSRVWSFAYTGGRFATLTYPSLNGTLHTRQFGYNVDGNITSETDPRGKVWSRTYNGVQLDTYKDPVSAHVWRVSYQTGSTAIQLPNLNASYGHVYDSNGLLIQSRDPENFETVFGGYNANRLPTQVWDKNGNQTTFLYDAMGNVTEITNPAGTVTHQTFSAMNDLASSSSSYVSPYPPYASIDQVRSNDVTGGTLNSVTNELGHTTHFDYDIYGQIEEKRVPGPSPQVYVTTYQHDSRGNLVKVTRPDGTFVESTFDDYGMPLTVTDGQNTTTMAYDAWSRVTQIMHPGGATVSTTYNATSQRLSATNELGRVTAWAYDDAGRLITHTRPRASGVFDVEEHTWNNLWQRDSWTNGNGGLVYYLHTLRGDLHGKLMAENLDTNWFYTRDGNGNVTQRFVSGEVTNYTYDSRDNLTEINYPAGTPDVTFTYDGFGRRTAMTDGTGTTTWAYDDANQVVTFDPPGTDKIEYTYRPDGQRDTMDRNGQDTTYHYDIHGRSTGLTNPLSETTTFNYDILGRISTRIFDSGQREAFEYDTRNRLTRVRVQDSQLNTLRDNQYVYDAASRITSRTTGGVTTTYTYDWRDQLLSETRTGYAASYTYDHNGNRLTRTVNGQTEAYHYDGTDQLLEITGVNSRTFQYDAQGRTTSITYDPYGTPEVQSFTYDHESRVTSVTRIGATVSYAYNGLDTRTSVTSGSNTNHFLRDGAYVTDPVLVDSGAQYTPGISERRGTKTTYLHSGLKNAFAQSDTSQQVAATREFDAFGNVTSPTGTWEGPFGYAGKFGYQSPSIPGVAMPDAGITLMGHRYYDPSTGRFLTRDPIFDGRNWYSYGSGEANPITGVDPDGRIVIILAVGVVVITAASLVRLAWEWDRRSDEYAADKRDPSQNVYGCFDLLYKRQTEDVPVWINETQDFAQEQFVDHYVTGPIGETDKAVKIGIEFGKALKEFAEWFKNGGLYR